MTQPTAAALRATGLGQRFHNRWALRDIDIELAPGRVVALVGPNGSGKSTLLNLAAGLLRPSAGEMLVLGSQPGSPNARGRVALLAQDKPLHAGLTVADQLRAGSKLNGRWSEELARSVIAESDIRPGARGDRLSPGQRSRLALAMALGRQPDLLLLDEPLADLDPVARQRMLGMIMADNAERGTTVVMSSHVLAEVEQVCDHVILLKEGRVRLDGDTHRLCADHTMVTGRADADGLPPRELSRQPVVETNMTGRQFSALVRGPVPASPRLLTAEPSLEDLVLAYMRTDSAVHSGTHGSGEEA